MIAFLISISALWIGSLIYLGFNRTIHAIERLNRTIIRAYDFGDEPERSDD